MILAIDPGMNGAVCCLSEEDSAAFYDTPTVKVKVGKGYKRKYVPELMADILARFPVAQQPIVVIEEAQAMPAHLHGRKQGVSSSFAIGYGAGLWRGIAAGLRLPVVMVTPRAWKKAMLGGGSDKGASIRAACAMFPHVSSQLARVKDDGRAEALLIAAYYRKFKSGSGQAQSA